MQHQETSLSRAWITFTLVWLSTACFAVAGWPCAPCGGQPLGYAVELGDGSGGNLWWSEGLSNSFELGATIIASVKTTNGFAAGVPVRTVVCQNSGGSADIWRLVQAWSSTTSPIVRFEFYGASDLTTYSLSSPEEPALTNGQFHWLAVVYDPGPPTNYGVYVDGAAVLTTNLPQGIYLETPDFDAVQVGCSGDAGDGLTNSQWAGQIDVLYIATQAVEVVQCPTTNGAAWGLWRWDNNGNDATFRGCEMFLRSGSSQFVTPGACPP